MPLLVRLIVALTSLALLYCPLLLHGALATLFLALYLCRLWHGSARCDLLHGSRGRLIGHYGLSVDESDFCDLVTRLPWCAMVAA